MWSYTSMPLPSRNFDWLKDSESLRNRPRYQSLRPSAATPRPLSDIYCFRSPTEAEDDMVISWCLVCGMSNTLILIMSLSAFSDASPGRSSLLGRGVSSRAGSPASSPLFSLSVSTLNLLISRLCCSALLMASWYRSRNVSASVYEMISCKFLLFSYSSCICAFRKSMQVFGR